MAQSVLEIYNLALSAAGSVARVTSVSETSREAILCSKWYELVRNNVMKAAAWPSLKQHAVLVVLSTRDWAVVWAAGDPMPEYTYSYTLPTDMLAPRRLASWAKFEIGLDGTDRALHTQDSVAVLQYTQLVEDPADWDSGLYQAVMQSLAYHISFALTKKVTLTKQLGQIAFSTVSDMRLMTANDQDTMYESLPEELTARAYSALPVATRYMYPHDTLLGVSV